jgi:hypothetical protein
MAAAGVSATTRVSIPPTFATPTAISSSSSITRWAWWMPTATRWKCRPTPVGSVGVSGAKSRQRSGFARLHKAKRSGPCEALRLSATCAPSSRVWLAPAWPFPPQQAGHPSDAEVPPTHEPRTGGATPQHSNMTAVLLVMHYYSACRQRWTAR